MKALFLFVGATALAGCADRGAALQQPVGTTTAPMPAAPRSSSERFASEPPKPKPDACAEPPVVAFTGDSTTVSESQLDALGDLAECLGNAPNEATRVVLIGYTDLIGTVPENIELGITRAQSVMRYLMSRGVGPGRIVVASAGELQRPSARLGLHAPRVEVLIARGGPPRPNEAPVARGIDAEGLIRRPPQKASSSPAPTPSPAPAPRPRTR